MEAEIVTENYAHLSHVITEARKRQAVWDQELERMRQLHFSTLCVHGGYTPAEAIRNNQGSVVEPVYSSTAQAHADSDWLEAALAYQIPAWVYSRIANPTVGYLETVLSLLEGYRLPFQTAACCTSSGMSAIKAATEPFVADRPGNRPKNIVAMVQCYGGTYQQFDVRYGRERGIPIRWVHDATDLDEWNQKIDSDTCFVFGEFPSNPGLAVFDIQRVAELAHGQGVPLIVDSTIATPALCRPLSHGADIVVQSLTKTMTSSGRGIGGALISKNGMTCHAATPEMRDNYAGWVKLWPYRDAGPSLSPESAAHTLDSIKTLRMKMDVLSQNAMHVAQFLEDHPAVESVNYLGLSSHPQHALAKRYMRLVDSEENRYGHLLSFTVKGGANAARKVLDRLELVFRATDLGRIKSVATIPSISTHQQQGEHARLAARIPAALVRLCVGGEDPEDLIADLDRALTTV
ncbi:O-acetylhomoserine aminocarboxypropyltransferase/cysteine synthase [Candidatus Micrarchaeota archaeon]|nr:O-acetylhomoserine aminocarboxypropyltransferase/cysteine synthase [Candidatus Micrarchaeota archaeon]